MVLRTSDIFSPPVLVSTNPSSVSPEPYPHIPVLVSNGKVGPFPPTRQLSNPGVCKVLVVDDSRANVKIMIRLVNQVSRNCFHRMGRKNRPAPVNIGGCETNKTLSSSDNRKLRVVGRGRSYHYSPGDGGYSSEEEEEVEEEESEVGVKMMYGEADDGQVAVKMVQEAAKAEAPYDIVFMDNTMLIMHGPEAAQQMRAGGFKGLIVGVTGNVMAEDRDKYTLSGADYVLGKPVKVNELQQILLQFN